MREPALTMSRRPSARTAVAGLLLVLCACAGQEPTDAGPPVNFVPASSRIDTAGQPGREWLGSARAAGYGTVINLAPPDADGAIGDEREILEAAGVTYVNIPVDWSNPTDDDFERFRAALAASAPDRALVHCQINMRASAFTFLYRVIEEDADPEMAWLRVTDVWVPDGRWRRFIDNTLLRHGETFRP